ncbi:MAG: helix-turn-helix transcriptional regulator [Planctomycetaceae bacterium]|nr:helix-turn-helix transcriptional regulator [Planctomycetaceae bacterium]
MLKPNTSVDLPTLAKLELRRRELAVGRSILAKKSGLSLKTVDGILTGKETNPRLATIHAIAKTLGVSVCVGAASSVSEVISADDMRRQRAIEKANRLAGGVQASMGLEAQGIDPQARASLVERTVHKLLAGPSRRLWDD